MDAEEMESVLMLRAETRRCTDCAEPTIFLPVDEHGWVCTACDAAVLLTDPSHAWVSAA